MRYSVLIPAYNAAAFVEQAIRSVSDYAIDGDYEILVADDGSTDETLSFLRELEQQIPSLTVYTKANGGPAAARNFLLDRAKGDYILFCDSDDSFTPGGVEAAVQCCEKQQASLLIFGFLLVEGDGAHPYCYKDCLLEQNEDWQRHLAPLYGANMLNQVWGKVFSSALLKSIRFPDTMWGEDRLFFFEALDRAERVAVSSACHYRYIQHPNSLISRFLPDKCRVCEAIHQRIRSLAESRGALHEEGEALYSYMYVKSLLSAFATLYAPSCTLTRKEKRAFVGEALRQESLDEIRFFPADCGRSFAILAWILRRKSIGLNLLAAWGVRTASRIAPTLLRKAKHQYNKDQKEQ